MTRPKPGTKSLPLGTSIFCGVSCFVSDAVCDVVSTVDSFVSTLGVSTVGVVICTGAAGSSTGVSVTGAFIGFTGLIGLTGLFTFIGLLVVI